MSDRAHDETEKLIAQAEAKVKKEYQKAVKETQAKLDDYLRRFKVKDEKWRLMVARGEKTKEEYQKWRTGQIMMGKRWQEMVDTLAEDYHQANVKARSIVNGYSPAAYALNHNYATFQVERSAKVDTSYTLYSRESVERILRDEPELLPPPGANMKRRIDEGKDIAWQKGQIQSVTLQSILQGESIPTMSARIAREMGESNHKNTIRYARTAITGAQNAGRMDAFARAESLGIELEKTWIATLDNRTRHNHRLLDGQKVATDKPFKVEGYEIMFPGDPSADGEMIWNCRCTMISQVKGFERDPRDLGLRRGNYDGMTYDEWIEAKPVSHSITKQEEIAETMRRRYNRKLYKGK